SWIYSPGRAFPLEAKPAMIRKLAGEHPDRRDGVEDGGTQKQHIQLTGEALSGPPEETPSGREAYKGKPESAATKTGRESEMATVPLNFGKTGGREGPLLSSSDQNRERQPECPRKGKL